VKYIKLFESMTSTKMVHHMTLEEYKREIVPLIIELKKILRKKFLLIYPGNYNGINFLPKDKWVKAKVDWSLNMWKKNDWKVTEDIIKERTEEAEEEWVKSGGKDRYDPKLYKRFKEIKDILEKRYLDTSKIDLSKAHKDNKKEVREALTSDTYVNEIKNGVINYSEMEEVCKYHNIRIPKRVLELKTRYEGKGKEYIRRLTVANKEFKQEIRKHLSQYIEELKDIKRENILKRVEYIIERNPDRFTNEIDQEIRKYLNYNFKKSKWERVNKVYKLSFNESIEKDCEEYAESYISNFIHRLEDKTNIINTKLDIPEIEFNNTTFRSGQLETNFILTYSNSIKLTGYCNVIIAGGYVQSLHQRYLFHFYLNGNKVSLEQIDKF